MHQMFLRNITSFISKISHEQIHFEIECFKMCENTRAI